MLTDCNSCKRRTDRPTPTSSVSTTLRCSLIMNKMAIIAAAPALFHELNPGSRPCLPPPAAAAVNSSNHLLSAVRENRSASSMSSRPTMLLGGGHSSASSAHASLHIPPLALLLTLVPPAERKYRRSGAARCARSRLACSTLRARAFSIPLIVDANFWSAACLAAVYRSRTLSGMTPTSCGDNLNAGRSSSCSSGRMIPCVETRSLIMGMRSPGCNGASDERNWNWCQNGDVPNARKRRRRLQIQLSVPSAPRHAPRYIGHPVSYSVRLPHFQTGTFARFDLLIG
ncbi:hypothetical protein EDB89DRAFT_345817 [Lactarius sanguifluus]|nr:hypothetical protein EDB89DRAFT_345817 [Lactarius sanguifluus]